MKRVSSILIVFALLFSAMPAFSAAAPGTPEYERMKEYKAAQRKAREEKKKGGAAAEKKEPGFWDREAERSGFAQTGQGMGSFFKNLNPVPFFKEQGERYEERKAAAGSR